MSIVVAFVFAAVFSYLFMAVGVIFLSLLIAKEVYAILSALVFSFVPVLSSGIAASLLLASSSWVVSATVLAVLGIYTAASAPGQPLISHIFFHPGIEN
jgi:hypothetical protein